ncbi:undecaprenyl diphosphate synthase [Thermobaculum terrenum ATCC BAA-798]|uniref:Isoprenyl transferase n=1 Tax=Thermobaculum terrenum (strain ATCC BAA-798 / CCMEE 7001 / YNP1) TaxID=525904 RepID=D1CCA7_THET1|nr:isoprenyl transferase [Thermobaculum terrenum]ACZ42422.1 undecaprenyl diphosphate synthase [Thermobaculum terrenum ATCC BAA-798]
MSNGIPNHIGIIMDGNGRWAVSHGLPRYEGHRAGVRNIRNVVEACVELGIKYLTVYAFSTENWSRPPEEVSMLLSILENVLKTETPELHKNGVQIRHLGSLDELPEHLQHEIRKALELTKYNDRLVLSVAYNYGGRAEIVHAVKRIILEGVPPDKIDEHLFSQYLYTAGLPDPDLIIRTAGEMRLSNFLIWQAAYAEYWSTPVFWPDFTKEHLKQAVEDYGRRQRKFGGLLEED